MKWNVEYRSVEVHPIRPWRLWHSCPNEKAARWAATRLTDQYPHYQFRPVQSAKKAA